MNTKHLLKPLLTVAFAVSLYLSVSAEPPERAGDALVPIATLPLNGETPSLSWSPDSSTLAITGHSGYELSSDEAFRGTWLVYPDAASGEEQHKKIDSWGRHRWRMLWKHSKELFSDEEINALPDNHKASEHKECRYRNAALGVGVTRHNNKPALDLGEHVVVLSEHVLIQAGCLSPDGRKAAFLTKVSWEEGKDRGGSLRNGCL